MLARTATLVVLSLSFVALLGANKMKHPKDSTTCMGAGTNSFVGGQDGNNAYGKDSGVSAGFNNTVCDDQSSIGGGSNNLISSSGADTAQTSFIGGGDQDQIISYAGVIGGGHANVIYDAPGGGYASQSVVGGGDSNIILASSDSTIGGGAGNIIEAEAGNTGNATLFKEGGYWSTIAGGNGNVIEAKANSGAQDAAIGGGFQNFISGDYASISGGYGNDASGYLATIPGGYKNIASGTGSFAAGIAAQATFNGSFVWSDDANSSVHAKATAANEFVARASGGVKFYSNAGSTVGVSLAPGSGTWSSLSDRNLKAGVATVDDAQILAKIADLPISRWSYVSEHGVRHLGPMAQDFYAAFHVGADDRHIATIDEDGVALAAIKALHAENRALRTRVANDEFQHARDRMLHARDEARLSALERAVSGIEANPRSLR